MFLETKSGLEDLHIVWWTRQWKSWDEKVFQDVNSYEHCTELIVYENVNALCLKSLTFPHIHLLELII